MAPLVLLLAIGGGARGDVSVTGAAPLPAPLPRDAAGPEIGGDPSLRGPKQAGDSALLDRCSEYAEAHGIDLYRYHLRLVGNRSSFFAPCSRTADGGVVLVGTVKIGPPPSNASWLVDRGYAARLDADWRVVWERRFARPRFETYEGLSGVQRPDGDLLVAIGGYVNPSRTYVTWLIRLSPAGDVRWEYQTQGEGGPGTPCPQTLRLLDDGGVLLEGHSYPDAKAWRSERAYVWRGIVDARGKRVLDEVGAPLK
jgi:hypothetical protein